MTAQGHWKFLSDLSKLGQAISDELSASGLPLITNYELFRMVANRYAAGGKLYLRRAWPTREDYSRLRRSLKEARIIATDKNYRHAYRVLINPDGAPEEICCLADPFCYIAHLSAMQRYSLTDRRPASLQIVAPHPKLLPDLIAQKMTDEYGARLQKLREDEFYPLTGTGHPKSIRRKTLSVTLSVTRGERIQIRDSHARIATIGQTFLDMLTHPADCGGMEHVIETWTRYAGTYVMDIITAVDRSPSSIAKVRAGYLLDEVMGLDDTRIASWCAHAQRGGSRRLDPSRPYAPPFSQKWMISLNAGPDAA